ncbi:MAG: TetR/AcrR family transcriptional regulator [Polyangiales bacterium]
MTVSRKVSKERTRARLIQGTLKVLHKDGAAALTTGRIAESAGVAQPTFYVHFSGLDDALKQAAEYLGERWVSAVAANRNAAATTGHGSLRGVLDAYVGALLDDTKAAEIFLRHRRDPASTMGRELRRLAERARDQLVRDLAEVGGLSFDELAPMGDLCLGVVLGVVESVLDKRADRDVALDAGSRMVEGVVAMLGGHEAVVAAE